MKVDLLTLVQAGAGGRAVAGGHAGRTTLRSAACTRRGRAHKRTGLSPMPLQQQQQQSVSLPLSVTPIPPAEHTQVEELTPVTKAARRGRRRAKPSAVQAAQVTCMKIGSWSFTGVAVLLVAGIGAFSCLVIGVELWTRLAHPAVSVDFKSDLPWWMLALNVGTALSPFAVAAGICYGIGRGMHKQATRLETVLLTHTNTAHLPAKESLVRASQEPMQAQEAVLLRAATQASERQEGHLLRAAGGTPAQSGRRAEVMQKPQTGKRIVSKGAYVRVQLGRVGQIAAGTYNIGLSLLLVGIGIWGNTHRSHLPLQWRVLCGLILFVIAAAFFSAGVFVVKRARIIDTGVPLTRANTADLPAPDSLVRASQEPMQAQEAVLLRAATGGQEDVGQLLRAAAGGRE